MQETQVPSLGWEDPLEQEMATHSSIFAWKIPWTQEPGGATTHRASKNQTGLSTSAFLTFPFYFLKSRPH